MSSEPEYTLVIRYRVVGQVPQRQTRRIPWRWYPSGSDVFTAIRRLRSQEPEAEVQSATLYQTALVERYNVNPEEPSE
jgi:hypothetical protein